MNTARISFILFLSFLSLIQPAYAEIKISNITGDSVKTDFIADGDNSGLRIFGGFAGDETKGTCATKNGISTCNNCVVNGSTFAACNLTRAYGTLKLQITFSSTTLDPLKSPTGFVPKIEPVVGSADTPPTMSFDNSPDKVTTANQNATVSVTWKELCETTAGIQTDLGGTPSECKISANQSFLIGFDADSDGLTKGEDDDSTSISITIEGTTDGTATGQYGQSFSSLASCEGGLCNFSLKPGDKKAFIENTTFKDLVGTNLDIANVLLYCDATTDFTAVTQSTPTAIIPSPGGDIPENKLEGFQNGTTYSCHAASQDEAGNIGLFLKLAAANCPTGSPASICRQVTPDSVIGLFSKDANCFIATAAYGSSMEPHVQMLRDFRNKYLAPTALGRSVVRLYYAVSPPIARWIAQDPDRRAATRALLTPVVWGVSVFMNWSWILGVAVLFGCGLLAFRRKFFLRFK